MTGGTAQMIYRERSEETEERVSCLVIKVGCVGSTTGTCTVYFLFPTPTPLGDIYIFVGEKQ